MTPQQEEQFLICQKLLIDIHYYNDQLYNNFHQGLTKGEVIECWSETLYPQKEHILNGFQSNPEYFFGKPSDDKSPSNLHSGARILLNHAVEYKFNFMIDKIIPNIKDLAINRTIHNYNNKFVLTLFNNSEDLYLPDFYLKDILAIELKTRNLNNCELRFSAGKIKYLNQPNSYIFITEKYCPTSGLYGIAIPFYLLMQDKYYHPDRTYPIELNSADIIRLSKDPNILKDYEFFKKLQYLNNNLYYNLNKKFIQLGIDAQESYIFDNTRIDDSYPLIQYDNYIGLTNKFNNFMNSNHNLITVADQYYSTTENSKHMILHSSIIPELINKKILMTKQEWYNARK